MKQFTKEYLINLLRVNTLKQPKAKYSNKILLKMLDNLDNDFVAELEPTRGGFEINRGSLAECIIKYAITGQTTKSQATQSDLNTLLCDNELLSEYELPKSQNIEIKFSTSFAPATHKSNKARYVIIVSQLGIHLINSKDLIYTPSGKLNAQNQRFSAMHELTKLEERLGLL